MLSRIDSLGHHLSSAGNEEENNSPLLSELNNSDFITSLTPLVAGKGSINQQFEESIEDEPTEQPIVVVQYSRKMIILALLASMTFGLNAMIAASGKDLSAIKEEGVNVMTPLQWVFGCNFLVSSLSINIPQTLDFLTKAKKKIRIIGKEMLNTPSRLRLLENLSIVLTTCGAAGSAGMMGYEAFQWIPLVEDWGVLQPLYAVTLINTLISASLMFATRLVGSKSSLDRFHEEHMEEKMLQIQFMKALRRLNHAEQAILGEIIISLNCNKPHPSLLIQQLLLEPQTKKLLFPHLEERLIHKLYYLFSTGLALLAGLAGAMTYSQKFIDGIVKFEETLLHSAHFLNMPAWAKAIPGGCAGLATGALFAISTIDAFPIMFDSLFNRTRNKKLSYLLTYLNICACASMFVIARGITKNPDNIFSFPDISLEENYSAAYFLIIIFQAFNSLGAFTTNGKSSFNLLARKPTVACEGAQVSVVKHFKKGVDLNDIIFYLEQNKLESKRWIPIKNSYKKNNIFQPPIRSPQPSDLENQEDYRPLADGKKEERGEEKRLASRHSRKCCAIL